MHAIKGIFLLTTDKNNLYVSFITCDTVDHIAAELYYFYNTKEKVKELLKNSYYFLHFNKSVNEAKSKVYSKLDVKIDWKDSVVFLWRKGDYWKISIHGSPVQYLSEWMGLYNSKYMGINGVNKLISYDLR